MSLLATQRPPALATEVTTLFDGIDRWKLAAKFGIDRIHDRTRLQVLNAVAAGSPCTEFDRIVSDIAVAGGVIPPAFPVINWAEFTSDIPEENRILGYGMLQPLAETHRWLHETIARHCPFVTPSLRHGRVWMSVVGRQYTIGQRILHILQQAQDAFLRLTPPEDRNRVLNTLLILLPELELPGAMSTLDFLGAHKQDFGEEMSKEVTLGAFAPSYAYNAYGDQKRSVPPLFVFRQRYPHRVARQHDESTTLLRLGSNEF